MAFPDGWNYYKEYSQPGTSDGEKTDYQVDITIEHLMGKMRSDFGDVRFTDIDGNELYYHLVSYTASDEALFVVKIPVLPTSGTTLKVYYGNPDATTTSNPANVYEFYDDATGIFSDKWNIIEGTASYSTVGNKQAISLSSSSTTLRAKNYQTSNPFKIECQLYATELITQIGYHHDSAPAINERYWARIDPRITSSTDGWEALMKDNAFIGTKSNVYITGSTWADIVVTVDQDGNHKLLVNGTEAATATDTTYTTGYLALNHHNEGSGACANLRVRKYTANPPATGTFGEEIELILKKYFRAKLKIIEEIRKRFRSKLWVSPERVQFRGKLNIFKRSEARFRAKLRTKTLNPQYISVKEYFRAKISTQALENERFRAKVRINSGETRVELMAKVVLKQSEFDIVNPEFEFRIGGERYDS